MYKRSGFTILELMVTVGIMAIMATISAPNISRMLARSKFDGEVQGLLSTIAEARANALSSKRCTKLDGSKEPSITWAVKVDHATNFYELYCFWNKDILTTSNFVFEDTVSFTEGIMKKFSFSYVWTDAFAKELGADAFMLHYWSGMPQVTIVSLATPKVRKEALRIVSEGSYGDIKTICVNRVAGFPTFNKNGSDCID